VSRFKVGPLLYVEWWDHTGSCRGWTHESEIGECGPSTVRTVGWLFKENSKTLVILGGYAEHAGPDDESEVIGIHTILKSCIKRRVKLRDPSREKR
jgi:hypothetical protein